MNPAEAAYVAARTAQSKDLWRTYLAGAGIDSSTIKRFIPKGTAVAGVTLPNIAVAVSGGGFRCALSRVRRRRDADLPRFSAMLTGGSILSGFDNRNASAVAAGTGGILQLANYAAGLSGGAWCIGSWAAANYPTFEGESWSSFLS